MTIKTTTFYQDFCLKSYLFSFFYNYKHKLILPTIIILVSKHWFQIEKTITPV